MIAAIAKEAELTMIKDDWFETAVGRGLLLKAKMLAKLAVAAYC